MRDLTKAVGNFGPCLGLATLAVLAMAGSSDARAAGSPAGVAQTMPAKGEQGDVLTARYLEIVTPEVAATCEVLARHHGVLFGEPVPELGNARVARLSGGGRIAVRAPMAAHEMPVVRPYLLVSDIEAAVEQAVALGAEVAHPPLEIPGQGTFAIYVLGGIQHGLWQD